MPRRYRTRSCLPRLRAALSAAVDSALFLLLAPVALILAAFAPPQPRPAARSGRQTPLEGARHRA